MITIVLGAVRMGGGLQYGVPAIARGGLDRADAPLERLLRPRARLGQREAAVFGLPAGVDRVVVAFQRLGNGAIGKPRVEGVRGVVDPSREMGVDVAGGPLRRLAIVERAVGVRLSRWMRMRLTESCLTASRASSSTRSISSSYARAARSTRSSSSAGTRPARISAYSE